MLWDRILALVSLILGGLSLALSTTFPRGQGPGPELFPSILGMTLVMFSVILLLNPSPDRHEENSKGWLSLALVLVFFALSPTLVTHLGLAVAAALGAASVSLLLKEPLARLLVTSLIVWLLGQYIFVRWLGIPG